jgi:hypothetical protein
VVALATSNERVDGYGVSAAPIGAGEGPVSSRYGDPPVVRV